MENEKQQQNEDKRHHHQEEDIQQHQKHQEEGEEQKQQQQHHQDEEKQQQKQQQKKQEEKHKQQEEAENEQNHALSPFPLSKRSTSPRTIPKAQSPPFDHSPVDSQLSPDHSSLSYGFSDPPPISQPSDPNSMPPAVAVSTIEVEEQSQKPGYGTHLSILRRIKRDKRVKRALLGFRISGFVFCLVSFSVLAADKDQGWALDSFYRYKEFRFCMAVNVIGFVYSGFQAYDLAYQLTSGKQKPRSHLRCYLDFILDQMLAYLLISASSSAAVRVDDWQSNWGKDKFPEMARASMALSLVAFIALASSSLISGYTLCTFKSM
ncbi:CASP-like protein 4A1 [Durio zibethinus]|uniref:CASP-like protein n=1 Tax=Durio zibethinus TaxID=66656 RepID=A0A6P5YI82_DURZI|nr:CASP-like protein 4A1 [Durio zibethinus]